MSPHAAPLAAALVALKEMHDEARQDRVGATARGDYAAGVRYVKILNAIENVRFCLIVVEQAADDRT